MIWVKRLFCRHSLQLQYTIVQPSFHTFQQKKLRDFKTTSSTINQGEILKNNIIICAEFFLAIWKELHQKTIYGRTFSTSWFDLQPTRNFWDEVQSSCSVGCVYKLWWKVGFGGHEVSLENPPLDTDAIVRPGTKIVLFLSYKFHPCR